MSEPGSIPLFLKMRQRLKTARCIRSTPKTERSTEPQMYVLFSYFLSDHPSHPVWKRADHFLPTSQTTMSNLLSQMQALRTEQQHDRAQILGLKKQVADHEIILRGPDEVKDSLLSSSLPSSMLLLLPSATACCNRSPSAVVILYLLQKHGPYLSDDQVSRLLNRFDRRGYRDAICALSPFRSTISLPS